MMAVPLGELLAVIGTGPLRLWNGVAGPFVERLPRNFEQAQRMWIHSLWPLVSFTRCWRGERETATTVAEFECSFRKVCSDR
jgi:hypothetical protein